VVARLELVELRRADTSRDEDTLPLSAIENRPVAAIAGVAQPSLFFQQLSDRGAIVTPFAFPDHHHFSETDISRVLAAVGANDALVVCTLKDAVKLAPIWPARARPLWYVLQGLELESGGNALADLLLRLTPQKSTELKRSGAERAIQP
jgi:tetraacyldisaccharide 4'-kinase